MANITFTIPSVLNQSGGEKKLKFQQILLLDAFTKISEQLWVMILSVEYWKVMELLAL